MNGVDTVSTAELHSHYTGVGTEAQRRLMAITEQWLSQPGPVAWEPSCMITHVPFAQFHRKVAGTLLSGWENKVHLEEGWTLEPSPGPDLRALRSSTCLSVLLSPARHLL